jgi:hypothetical protein
MVLPVVQASRDVEAGDQAAHGLVHHVQAWALTTASHCSCLFWLIIEPEGGCSAGLDVQQHKGYRTVGESGAGRKRSRHAGRMHALPLCCQWAEVPQLP